MKVPYTEVKGEPTGDGGVTHTHTPTGRPARVEGGEWVVNDDPNDDDGKAGGAMNDRAVSDEVNEDLRIDAWKRGDDA